MAGDRPLNCLASSVACQMAHLAFSSAATSAPPTASAALAKRRAFSRIWVAPEAAAVAPLLLEWQDTPAGIEVLRRLDALPRGRCAQSILYCAEAVESVAERLRLAFAAATFFHEDTTLTGTVSGGSYSVTPGTALAEGNYTATATVHSVSGVPGSATDPGSIDTTATAAPTTSCVPGGITG